MQKNWLLKAGILSLIAIQLHVDADWSAKSNNKSKKNNEAQAMPMGMYHNDNRNVFVRGDYLFWLPQQEDCFYTVKVNQESSENELSLSYKQPSFNLSSGVRVGVGGFNSDRWDIGLVGMYIYGQGNNSVGSTGSITNATPESANPEGTANLPDFDNRLFGIVRKSQSTIRLNHFVGDLNIGREFFLTRRFSIHPVIGARGFGIFEHLIARYKGRSDGTTPISTEQPQKFNARNNIYGAGPRAGIDLAFYFNKNFSILGGFSGSLLLSRYHTHQKFQALVPTPEDEPTEYVASQLKTSDKGLLLRSNIDAYFGLGWESWYNNDKNRFHFAILCEASEWFGVNQLNDTNIGTVKLNTTSRRITDLRRHGDLGYLGGTVRFQYDF